MKPSRRPVLAFMLAVSIFAALISSAEEAGLFEADRLGPAPRDADGRFTNPGGDSSHGSFGVRFPFFLRRFGGFFRGRPGVPIRIDNDGAFLRENAMHSAPTVTWVGHATLLVQMDHVTFLTDPIWSDKPSPISFLGPRRFVSPGVALEDLPPIDFVVISHNHYDHLDLPTLAALAERDPKTRFLVPLGNARLLRNAGIERVEPDIDHSCVGGKPPRLLGAQRRRFRVRLTRDPKSSNETIDRECTRAEDFGRPPASETA